MVLGIGLCGCMSVETRIAGRTTTEQRLTTASIGRALDNVRWDRLEGKRVALRIVSVQPAEDQFFRAALESRLGRKRIQVVENPEDADVLVTALIHSMGTDIRRGQFGIPIPVFGALGPTTAVPSGLGGLSLYNSNLQEGYCRVEFYGTSTKTNKLLWRSEPVEGNSFLKTTKAFGFIGPIKKSDIYFEEDEEEEEK